MRVSGGSYRGRRLEVPAELGTRPSSGRLRESLFQILSARSELGQVADLFAGSGALGIEALSRGAHFVEFVELMPAALRSIARNLRNLQVPSHRFRLRRMDARRWIQRRVAECGRERRFQCVLADPPYELEDALQVLLLGARLVESGAAGLFVLEHPTRARIDEVPVPDDLRCRTRTHGHAAFTIVERV
jgi:16S rRNA (guanine(966)-N(2))-methyltransferase RsmD